jgi:rRNA maturation protein Nop10
MGPTELEKCYMCGKDTEYIVTAKGSTREYPVCNEHLRTAVYEKFESDMPENPCHHGYMTQVFLGKGTGTIDTCPDCGKSLLIKFEPSESAESL